MILWGPPFSHLKKLLYMGLFENGKEPLNPNGFKDHVPDLVTVLTILPLFLDKPMRSETHQSSDCSATSSRMVLRRFFFSFSVLLLSYFVLPSSYGNILLFFFPSSNARSITNINSRTSGPMGVALLFDVRIDIAKQTLEVRFLPGPPLCVIQSFILVVTVVLHGELRSSINFHVVAAAIQLLPRSIPSQPLGIWQSWLHNRQSTIWLRGPTVHRSRHWITPKKRNWLVIPYL